MVSIIIPVKTINQYIREALPEIFKLNWPDFEVLILPDRKQIAFERDLPRTWQKHIRVIATGSVGPAKKRDIGASFARGEVLAFIDDDAYPTPGWLKAAERHLKKRSVAAVGGPAITPQSDGFWAKASGAVFESYMATGPAINRYLPVGKSKLIDDWPSVNLLVKKDIFNVVKGFSTNFYPGEDTKLCLDIVRLGQKIYYEPKALVYHHRRANLIKHFEQTANYAIHRGYFCKAYPMTSLRPRYLLPSLFNLYLIALGVWIYFQISQRINIFSPQTWADWTGLGLIIFTGLYLTWLVVSASQAATRHKSLGLFFTTLVLIPATHFWYGVNFIRGLIKPKLIR